MFSSETKERHHNTKCSFSWRNYQQDWTDRPNLRLLSEGWILKKVEKKQFDCLSASTNNKCEINARWEEAVGEQGVCVQEEAESNPSNFPSQQLGATVSKLIF